MFLPGAGLKPLSSEKKGGLQKVVYPKYCIRYAIIPQHICKGGKLPVVKEIAKNFP